MDARNLDFWQKTAFLEKKNQNLPANARSPARGYSTFTGGVEVPFPPPYLECRNRQLIAGVGML